MNEHQNKPNMKFKAGSYFMWKGKMLKISHIRLNSYECYILGKNERVLYTFWREDERDMKLVSKKLNPEYFL